jgi:acyl transferase domain-containing protein
MDKLAKASALYITEHSGKVVFVFSGQGNHYLSMGASLYRAVPIFKQNIDKCHLYLGMKAQGLSERFCKTPA